MTEDQWKYWIGSPPETVSDEQHFAIEGVTDSMDDETYMAERRKFTDKLHEIDMHNEKVEE